MGLQYGVIRVDLEQPFVDHRYVLNYFNGNKPQSPFDSVVADVLTCSISGGVRVYAADAWLTAVLMILMNISFIREEPC